MAKYVSKKFNPFIYPDWAEIFKTMDSEQRSEILMAITCFPNYEPRGVPLWGFFKSQLQNQYETWEERSEIYRSNAKSRKANDSEENQLPTVGSNSEQLPPIANNSKQLSVNRTVYKQNCNRTEQEYKQEQESSYTSNADALDVVAATATTDSVDDDKLPWEDDSPAPVAQPQSTIGKADRVPLTKIKDAYNAFFRGRLPECRLFDETRKRAVKKTYEAIYAHCKCANEAEGMLAIDDFFHAVEQSDWIMGRDPKSGGWRGDFDYVFSSKCIKRTLEKN